MYEYVWQLQFSKIVVKLKNLIYITPNFNFINEKT